MGARRWIAVLGSLSGVGVVLLAAVGCGPRVEPGSVPMLHEDHVVWLLPGIAGSELSMFGPKLALRDAGVQAEFRVFRWQRGVRFLDNLMDLRGNRARASGLAAEIAEHVRTHPGAPVDIVGYSGGGGLALLTAESLPVDVRLRRLVLVHPALSPDCDLEPALARVRDSLHVFYAPSDWFILGWGTNTFGTVDRRYTDSAGRVGFDLEHAVRDAALRGRVRQTRWRPEMIWSGHFGNHASILSYHWNRGYVAPALLEAAAQAEPPGGDALDSAARGLEGSAVQAGAR